MNILQEYLVYHIYIINIIKLTKGCIMNKFKYYVWILLSVFLVACGGGKNRSSDLVAKGEDLYAKQCAHCHGGSGLGVGSFPALTHGECSFCSDSDVLAEVISTTMPLGGALCTGDCAESVAAFITQNFNETEISSCDVKSAPARRLNRFEYSNTLQDLLGEDLRLGNRLPSEEIGNGFGNDAASMSVSSLLAEQYGKVADDVAIRTTSNDVRWRLLHQCIDNVNSSNEGACADQTIERLLTRSFRRPATVKEKTEYLKLYQTMRGQGEFKAAMASVISAVLQSPEFLYRIEFGRNDGDRLKPTAYEMASRLSYFLWGSMPDDALFSAAQSGALDQPENVLREARRMLNDPKSRRMIEYFFDSFLPISSLSNLERDPKLFPTFSAEIGSLMREEVHTLLQHVIFDGPGDWSSALTAPYSFMNEKLAKFYGVSGVSGNGFRLVQNNDNERLGFLTRAGVMAGTIHSAKTNPVVRGANIMKSMLCVDIPLPTGEVADLVTPPDPNSGATARDRFSQHSTDPVCKTCHKLMDPVGLVFEQFDPVGLFRTHENSVLIDTHGELPGRGVKVENALEMVEAIADDPRTYQCFSYNWANFAYGKTIGTNESCLKDSVEQAFVKSGYDVQVLLLDLTQTDAFLFLPKNHQQ